jgi:hypothetical protein
MAVSEFQASGRISVPALGMAAGRSTDFVVIRHQGPK